jgi:hypothetical protein
MTNISAARVDSVWHWRLGAALASALLIVGCKKTPTIDVASVNALVPAKYKYKLEFASRDVTSGLHRHVTYTVPVPKDWKSDDIGGAQPVDKAVSGDSSIWVHSSCDDAHCSPADWNAAIDQELKLLEVLRDERGDHRRVVTVKPGPTGRDLLGIKVYWWVDGEPEYHACEVRLGPGLQESAPAFEKACELAVVRK